MTWLALRLLRLLLKVVGYRRTVQVLARLSPTPNRIGYSKRMLIAARAIDRVDHWWPRHPRGCLRRSLLFWWIFRWFGYRSEIRTGVRRERGEIEFHAWVESGGMILNDKASKISQFAPLWDDISSRIIEGEGS